MRKFLATAAVLVLGIVLGYTVASQQPRRTHSEVNLGSEITVTYPTGRILSNEAGTASWEQVKTVKLRVHHSNRQNRVQRDRDYVNQTPWRFVINGATFSAAPTD